MAAAALTFREALEVYLVVMVVLSFVVGSARQHVRALVIAIAAAFLLGVAIGVGAGVFGASLGVKAKAIFQAAMMGLGALLMLWAVLVDPPYVRLERRLAARPDGDSVGVASVVFRALIPITLLTSVLLYDCAVATWGAADLMGGVLGSAMGVFVGLLGAAAILLIERLEPRMWRALIGLMVFLFVGYVIAYDLGAFPQAGLIPSPHISPDRGVSAIATVLGISTVALLTRLARRRGQFQPRPFLTLINPLFIGFAAYFVLAAIQQLALWYVIKFPEEVSWGVLVVGTVLTVVVFLRSGAVRPDSDTVRPVTSWMERLRRLQWVRRRLPLVRGRGPAPRPGAERARRSAS